MQAGCWGGWGEGERGKRAVGIESEHHLFVVGRGQEGGVGLSALLGGARDRSVRVLLLVTLDFFEPEKFLTLELVELTLR